MSPRTGLKEWLAHHDAFVMRLFKEAAEKKQYRQARNLILAVLIPQYVLTGITIMQLLKKEIDVVTVVLLAATSPLGAMLYWAMQSTVLLGIARLFGGRASWTANLIVVGLSMVPRLLQLLALPLLWLLSMVAFLQPLVLMVSLLVALWSAYLLYLGLRVIHDLGRGKTVVTIVIGMLIDFIVLTVWVSMFVAFLMGR